MPTVYVNDKPVEIGTQKLNCVQAAELAGVFVPHYCWHEALTVVASCRMCLVEMGDLKDGKVNFPPGGKVSPGCQTPVKDGTVIVTAEYDKRDKSLPVLPYDPNYTKAAPLGERAKKSQADTLEGLLINHPLDCPVCDKAGECKLQDFSYKYGRSESRMVDVKNTPPNKPQLSSKITLFTDRCIMCTRCVRFTREISGTAELAVMGRGHHEEIDVFPGRPLENKLAGNVVDLCPVGALGSKDFLYKQRVWYLKTTDGVCNRCSTGCSTYVDTNKDIVYRLRPRYNPKAQGHFMCDDGRLGYHHANSGERFVRPMVKTEGRFKPMVWSSLLPQLKQEFSDAAKANAKGTVAVLSPFLTVEEAFLLGSYFKSLSKDVRLVLGPVPVIGQDDKYPKNAKGEPPAKPEEPVKFTIRAEKAPNRVGVEAVLKQLQGEVIPFASIAGESLSAMWFAGGYPDPSRSTRSCVSGGLEGPGAARGARYSPDGRYGFREVRASRDDRVREGRHVREPRWLCADIPASRPATGRSAKRTATRRRPAWPTRACATRVCAEGTGRSGAVLRGWRPEPQPTPQPASGDVMPPFDPIYTAIVIVGLIGGVLGVCAYLTLGERKISAWMQDRIGPNRAGPGGLLQPIADGGKFFLKEEVIPDHVDKVFYMLAPAVAVGTALMALAIVPFGATTPAPNPVPRACHRIVTSKSRQRHHPLQRNRRLIPSRSSRRNTAATSTSCWRRDWTSVCCTSSRSARSRCTA